MTRSKQTHYGVAHKVGAGDPQRANFIYVLISLAKGDPDVIKEQEWHKFFDELKSTANFFINVADLFNVFTHFNNFRTYLWLWKNQYAIYQYYFKFRKFYGRNKRIDHREFDKRLLEITVKYGAVQMFEDVYSQLKDFYPTLSETGENPLGDKWQKDIITYIRLDIAKRLIILDDHKIIHKLCCTYSQYNHTMNMAYFIKLLMLNGQVKLKHKEHEILLSFTVHVPVNYIPPKSFMFLTRCCCISKALYKKINSIEDITDVNEFIYKFTCLRDLIPNYPAC